MLTEKLRKHLSRACLIMHTWGKGRVSSTGGAQNSTWKVSLSLSCGTKALIFRRKRNPSSLECWRKPTAAKGRRQMKREPPVTYSWGRSSESQGRGKRSQETTPWTPRDTVSALRDAKLPLCMLSLFHRVWLIVTLWTVALKDPLSMWFPRQE